jgi:hypothetical protein
MSDSLFHPRAGIWPLKSRTSGPFDDLIASMLTFGWIEEMPAILDEYGVVIDGNRRMIVAELWFNSWLGEAPPPPLRIGSECD